MTVDASSPPATRRRRLRRALVAVGVVAAVVGTAAAVLLPSLARPFVQRSLSAALGRPVSIERLAWEPVAGRVTAHGVSVGDGDDRITASRVLVEGSARALWRGALVVDRVEIDDPTATVELDAHYRPLLPGFGQPSEGPPALPPITVQQLSVRNAALQVHYPLGETLRSAHLHLTTLDSSGIAIADGVVQMRAQLAGSLDDAPVSLDATVHLAGDDTRIEATGSVAGLQVDRRTVDLGPALATFHAIVDVRGTYRSTSAPASDTLQLDATLHEPRITDDAGTEFAAQRIELPDVAIDLTHHAIAIDHVAIDQPLGTLQLDAQYRPTLGTFGADTVQTSAVAPSVSPTLALRELSVSDGQLTVRYPVRGQLRDVPLHIAQLTCADIDAADDRLAMSAQLTGTLDGAPLQAEARLRLGTPDETVDAHVAVRDLAVDRTRLELPVALESLETAIDLQATYASAAVPPRQTLQLDARLAAPRLSSGDAALTVKSIALPDIAIDLLQHRVDLGAVSLETPALNGELPSAARLLPPATSGMGDPSTWSVQSGAIELRNGSLRLRRDQSSFALSIATARWGGLTPGRPQPLSLRVAVDGGGALELKGSLALAPLDGAVDIVANALPLPLLAELTGVLPLRLAEGTGDATLHLSQHERRVRMRGQVRLHDARTVAPDPRRPTEVLALAAAQADLSYDSAASPPLDIASLMLSYPYALIQRSAGGLFPYNVVSAAAADPAAGTARSSVVRLRQVTLEGGRLEFFDSTLRPAFWTSVSNLTAQASELLFPAGSSGTFKLAGKRDEISALDVDGTFTAHGVEARAALQDALLESLNPYLAPLLGYDVTAGWLTLAVEAVPAPPLYNATARVQLSGVDLSQTGVDVIQRQSGVPLPIALGLIANSAGKIDLTLPLAVDPSSGRLTLGSVVGQAVRSAIVGALTSPLRILGSLFGTKGAPHAFAIDPIPFPPGSGTLDAAGAARVTEIARILQAHPSLVLVATPQITPADTAALAGGDPQPIADARAAAVRTALTDASGNPSLAPQRLMLVAWTPAASPPPTDLPGVYVELQDKP